MNTQKSIYNKLFKEEVQLESHKVELALIDDIKKLQVTANKTEDSALSELKKALSILQNASKSYLTARDNAVIVIKEIDKARLMSKELGVELPSNIEALANYYGKSVGENLQMSNKINQFINNAFN
jgi:hypothetical protein